MAAAPEKPQHYTDDDKGDEVQQIFLNGARATAGAPLSTEVAKGHDDDKEDYCPCRHRYLLMQ